MSNRHESYTLKFRNGRMRKIKTKHKPGVCGFCLRVTNEHTSLIHQAGRCISLWGSKVKMQTTGQGA